MSSPSPAPYNNLTPNQAAQALHPQTAIMVHLWVAITMILKQCSPFIAVCYGPNCISFFLYCSCSHNVHIYSLCDLLLHFACKLDWLIYAQVSLPLYEHCMWHFQFQEPHCVISKRTKKKKTCPCTHWHVGKIGVGQALC